MKYLTIHSLILRFLIIIGIIIFASTFLTGIYFNKYDEHEKRKDNLYKIHSILSQLIISSLKISDSSEVRRLLSTASSKEEAFLVVDNDRIVTMSDYSQNYFSNFVLKNIKFIQDCNFSMFYKYINNKKYLIHCSILKNNDLFSKNEKLGVLLSFTNYQWQPFSWLMFCFLSMIAFLFFLSIVFFRRILHKRLLEPLIILKNKITNISNEPNTEVSCVKGFNNAPLELIEIKDAFDKLLKSLHDEYCRRMAAEKMQILFDLAVNVAHDIKSPLAVMALSIDEAKSHLPDELVNIFQDAIQSVRDIANNLLSRYRNTEFSVNKVIEEGSQAWPVLIYSLLEKVIHQKKHEWRNNLCDIEFEAEVTCKLIWVNAVPNELRRILSNLLNNAYESLSNYRQIKISLTLIDNMIIISIIDQGCGIPSEKIPFVLNGYSLKHTGKGIGLSSAIKYVESFSGGKFVLTSEQHQGTQVTLKIPYLQNLDWFPDTIILNRKQHIVLLDDDPSIHEFWKNRFRETEITFINFYHSNDFLGWYNSARDRRHEFIFFIDYKLSTDKQNGIDIMKKIQPGRNGYLITSYAEELHFQNIAKELNIWLIPKTILGQISIRFT